MLFMGVQDRDWYWKDRDRKAGLHYNPKAFRGSWAAWPESARANPPTPTSRKIWIACLAMLCAAWFVWQWRQHDMSSRRAADRAQQTEVLRLQAMERDRVSLANRQSELATIQQEETDRVRLLIAKQHADAQASELAAIDERHRRALWANFYQPAPGCENNTTVQCANAFIRARQRFEATYGAAHR
jgi:hypothetical protein